MEQNISYNGIWEEVQQGRAVPFPRYCQDPSVFQNLASGRVCGQHSNTSVIPRGFSDVHSLDFHEHLHPFLRASLCPQESFLLLEVPVPCWPLPSITPPFDFPHRFFSAHLTLGFQTPPVSRFSEMEHDSGPALSFFCCFTQFQGGEMGI